ncbi:MAG: hypothetical protein ACKVS9_19040 [Phycisphaerae bacterium]
MDDFRPLAKYEIAALFREGVVEWALTLQTDDAKRHVMRVRDGEEVPLLLDLLRKDTTLYFSPSTATLRTGLNSLGS